MQIATRQMLASDVAEACALLNEIIRAGGTTAHEVAFSDATFAQEFLSHANLICCHVALDDRGVVAGFQTLWRDVDHSYADIATFARLAPVLRGVGRALFQDTATFARAAGLSEINATIRADNVPGLGYYSKMGFVDFSTACAIALTDGTPVDRISKRFNLS
ncbi:MAG: L-amino acid N-acyltransferase YncA [Paracoccaceae bacterium]|jgi:L-amino acid N-acyltransferase YncA